MNLFLELLQNEILVTAISSWALAQVIKVIINAIITKKLDFERLFGDGGMPSAHSATVTSMATMSALIYGLGSFEFAVTAIVAIVVCHDAMGVRQETGKQARILNEMMEIFEALTKAELPEVKLKEFVGHTFIQVIVGIALGIANAFAMYYLVF